MLFVDVLDMLPVFHEQCCSYNTCSYNTTRVTPVTLFNILRYKFVYNNVLPSGCSQFSPSPGDLQVPQNTCYKNVHGIQVCIVRYWQVNTLLRYRTIHVTISYVIQYLTLFNILQYNTIPGIVCIFMLHLYNTCYSGLPVLTTRVLGKSELWGT